MRLKNPIRFIFCLILLTGCSAQGIYYFPNAKLYVDPHQLGHTYEVVNFPSKNGKNLTGLYFESSGTPKGMIVYFHGNYGNLSHHFFLSTFLLKYDFNVLMIDYQGYGGSEGKPTPKKTIEDGQSAVQYAVWLSSSSPLPVGIFGQSLGASIGAVVAAKEPLVKAVVLEAGFSTYKKILRKAMKNAWITWPFSFFVPPMIAAKGYDPVDFVSSISPRPVLIIHGDQDKIVPVEMSQELFEAAQEPKRLHVVKGAKHLGCKQVLGEAYELEIAHFFEGVFVSHSNNKN